MKRDFDLIRTILKEIEATPTGKFINQMECEGFDPDVVSAHLVLLEEAGLIEAAVLKMSSGHSRVKVSKLTWEGHDFLDAIKDDTLWAKAKKNVIGPAGGIAFSVLLEWAKAEGKSRLGLPP